MKYSPREIRENNNISKTSPIREFLVLTLGIAGTLLLIYILLGVALNLVIPRISTELEDRLSVLFRSAYDKEDRNSPAARKMQKLLDELVSAGEFKEREYRVHLVPNIMVNAMALPGGHIVVFSGLVNSVESENELAMILGHELGHFQNRDHLRGLGRGLVLMLLSTVTLGVDSSVSQLLQSMLVNTEMRFSQKQELQSDLWGLDLLVRKYDHAGGATDFFIRMGDKEKLSRFGYLFATHPFPEKRVRALNDLIEERKTPILPTTPLSPVFSEITPDKNNQADH
jgi:Zn-dependent protease with chaperone function